MGDLLRQVRRTIETYSLIAAGGALVVGVSGGPDSLCLLHVLRRLAPVYGLQLHAAHLHHGLRGAEAEADANFVRDLAAAWGLPVTIEKLDVPALARDEGLAFEEAARLVRYDFLARTATAVGARTIAVGHNADDQAETVLMHFLRGSGLAGLRGMLPRMSLGSYRLLSAPRPDPRAGTGAEVETASLDLIRPLLEVTRAGIEAYCVEQGLRPRLDHSNLDTTYFRNWLRLKAIPLLEEHNPRLRAVLGRTARVLAGDYELLHDLLEEVWPRIVAWESEGEIACDLAAWRALPIGLQRSILREAVHRLRRSLRNISFVHVEKALEVAREGVTGDRATLPEGLMLTVGYERLRIASEAQTQPLPDWPLLPPASAPLTVAIPGCTPLPDSGWVLEAALLPRASLPRGWEDNPDPWCAYLDAGIVIPPLRLRTRQPGDRFRPLGMRGLSPKLADFLTNQKVPRVARDRLPLLVAAWGIAWVAGVRPDERAKVTESTADVLAVRFARL
jgi:tRNA(Ile)-lysidine synthase